MSTEKKEEPTTTTAMYAQFPGYSGGVKTPGYEGWISFSSFQFGAGLGISSGRRRRYGDDDDDEEEEEVDENSLPERECSEPSVSEITLTKSQDGSSCLMFYNLCARKMHDTITLDLVNIQDGKAKPFLRWVLRATYLSGFSTSWGTQKQVPQESLSLNFANMEVVSLTEDGVPIAGVAYHLPSATATFKSGPTLEVVEKHRKVPEKKEKKPKKNLIRSRSPSPSRSEDAEEKKPEEAAVTEEEKKDANTN